MTKLYPGHAFTRAVIGQALKTLGKDKIGEPASSPAYRWGEASLAAKMVASGGFAQRPVADA